MKTNQNFIQQFKMSTQLKLPNLGDLKPRKIDRKKLKEQLRRLQGRESRISRLEEQKVPEKQKAIEKEPSKSSFSFLEQLQKKQASKFKYNRRTESVDGQPYPMKFNFTPNHIMAFMSKDRLSMLSDIWNLKDGGLTVSEIILLLLNNIGTNDDEEKYELIYGAYQLFHEVDINGDGTLEWHEFMQYIIDAVDGNVFKEGENNETVQEQLEMLNALKYKRFQVSFNPMDQSKRKNDIVQTISCPANRQVLCFEKFQQEFKLYDYSMKVVKKLEVPFKDNCFIVSMAFDEKNCLYAACGSDSMIYFFIQTKVKYKFLKKVDAEKLAGCKQLTIWYIHQKKLWLTAGEDFKLREWDFSKQGEVIRSFGKHQDLVTCCINIEVPTNCIASCSLDRTIMIYDMTHGDIRVIDEKHDNGIRVLRYQKQNGNTMISIGNEIFANVWQPESLVSDVHIGKLKGHKVSVVDGDYLDKAPFFVTIDIENVVLFWDIKTLGCVQQINPHLKRQTLGLQIINQGTVWLYSKRFQQLDNQLFDDDEEAEQSKDNGNTAPLFVEFNRYTFQTIVVSKKDLKMYDLLSGKLKSILNNVFKKEEIGRLDITAFRMDKRHRKAYIANSKGEIFVINAQNGVMLKNVTQYLEDKKNIEQFKQSQLSQLSQSHTSLGSSRYSKSESNVDIYSDTPVMNQQSPLREKNKQLEQLIRQEQKEMRLEVKQMKQDNDQFEAEHKLKPLVNQDGEPQTKQRPGIELQSFALDNPEIFDIILVWDEDINMMLCANKKEFFVWDESEEESSKMLRRVSGGHKEDITILACDNHLSLVATGCINGEIALYDLELTKIEGILIGHKGDITGLEFLSPNPMLISTSMDKTMCIWAVRPSPQHLINVCLKKFINFSWSGEQDEPTAITKIKVWRQTMKGVRLYRRQYEKQLPAIKYRKFNHNYAFGLKSIEEIFQEEIRPTMFSYEPDPPPDEIFSRVLKTKMYDDLLKDEDVDTFITQGKYTPQQYNKTISEVKERIYVIVGDEKGFIKLWDLLPTVLDSGILPVKPMKETKTAYNPYRMEKVNCSELAQSVRLLSLNSKIPEPIEPSVTTILIREVKAHSDVITAIKPIELDDFQGFTTCSLDGKVRNWNIDLDLLGNISVRHEKIDPHWEFQTLEFKQQQETHLQEIEQIMEEFTDEQLGLVNPRRKLIISDYKATKKQEVKQSERSNWLKVKKEMEAQDLKMEQEQQEMRKKMMLEKLKNDLIQKKIQTIVAEQDVKFQAMLMDMPQIISDHPENVEGFKTVASAKALQHELNHMFEQKIKNYEHPDPAGGADLKQAYLKKALKNTIGAKISAMAFMTDRNTAGNKSPNKANQTLPLAHNRAQSLAQMVRDSDKDPIKSKFEDSKADRKNILDHHSLPSIRGHLKSIYNPRLRFSQKPEIEEMRSQYSKLVARSKNGSTRHYDRKLRPFSINDSEIQHMEMSDFKQPRLDMPSSIKLRMLPHIHSPQNRLGSQVLESNQASPVNNQNTLDIMSFDEFRQQIDLSANDYDGSNTKVRVNDYNISLPFSQAGNAPSTLITRNPIGVSSQPSTSAGGLVTVNSQIILDKARRKKQNFVHTADNRLSQMLQSPEDDYLNRKQSELSTVEMSRGLNEQRVLTKVQSIDLHNKELLRNNNPFNLDSASNLHLPNTARKYSELQFHSNQSTKNVNTSVVTIKTQQSVMDMERMKHFEAMKEKYCGKSPNLVMERQRHKETSEMVKDNYQKLKKIKLKTMK